MFKNYELIKEEHIPTLDGTGYLLKHTGSGARVMVVSNEDDNKVFNIAFRTPPADDTGLPHILEHSVLCGSKKFPVKDPFVELAKGSLNTFLNAMTYPDKTLYPVASCNDKDFKNLMEVYLDAVLYPNIYNDPRILQQEGWHYEMEALDGDITYNGVVYNEMKGASSSPEQVLFRQIQAVLFPEHPYGCDSGGDPKNIPELTNDDFLNFHKKYYHPSNSFVFLYGDMDVAERLQWLHEAYLKDFDAIQVDSSLTSVPAFETRRHEMKTYAVSQETGTDKKTFLSYNLAFDKPETQWESLALEILEYLLMDAPGAPLKEALLDLGIAEDVFGSYDSALNQPTFSIVAKNANPEDEEVFIATIEKVLKDVASEGIDKRKVEAAVNNFEFKNREADFGQYPKGIIYAIKALETWLYDGDPFEGYHYDKAFPALREALEKGALKELVKRYFLENTHCAVLQLRPDAKLLETNEAEVTEILKKYKDSLSEDEKKELIEQTKALKAFQAEPNSPEELATIPLLSIDDIEKDAHVLSFEEEKDNDITYIKHKTFTNGIIYGKLLFDFSQVAFEDVPYVSTLAKLLTKVSTDNYSYGALSDEINIHTGGIRASTNVYAKDGTPDECQTRLELKFKCFADRLPEALELVEEVVTGTLFDDEKRLNDLISENRSRLAMTLMSSGHSAAMTRSLSRHYLPGKYRDMLEGIDYYRFLEGLSGDNAMTELREKLKEVSAKVLVTDNLTVLINTEEEMMDSAREALGTMIESLPKGTSQDVEEALNFTAFNEGFKSSSKVQYNALTGNFITDGYEYTGYMKVLQTIMSLDYMWKEVRVKGGAYGGFSGFRRSGVFFLGSYRDPNLKKTYDIYKKLPDYIRAIDLDDRERTKYIIGTVSNMDTPMTPSMKGEKVLNMFMSDITAEKIQLERDQVLAASTSELTQMADMIEKVIEQNYITVIGNESVVEEEKDILDEVKPLFNN